MDKDTNMHDETELQEKLQSGDESRKIEELRMDELLRQRSRRRAQLEKDGFLFASEGDFDVMLNDAEEKSKNE